ncbi:MAG: transcription antitermination factor NusB [Candidatus Nomurabacteria bacterium]
MSTRHIARSLVLQTLFEIDQRCAFDISLAEALLVLKRISDEFGEDIKDISFAEILVKECLSRRITLDDIIVRAAPDWPLDKIGEVDRNILRLGLCELLFGDRSQVPPKVAIDEAIELAKTFGGETSGRFINGVLGAIYKEMGEPGKEQITKKVEKESMKHERLVGAVVISHHEGKRYVGLVHDVFGYWTLTKGKIEGEEQIEVLAIKKIKSEIGIEVTLTTILGENEYIANKPDEGKVVKNVVYYLAESEYTPLVLEKKGGLDDAKWFPEHEVMDLRMYDDIKPLITKALNFQRSN